jgi:hypothetical protein
MYFIQYVCNGTYWMIRAGFLLSIPGMIFTKVEFGARHYECCTEKPLLFLPCAGTVQTQKATSWAPEVAHFYFFFSLSEASYSIRMVEFWKVHAPPRFGHLSLFLIFYLLHKLQLDNFLAQKRKQKLKTKFPIMQTIKNVSVNLMPSIGERFIPYQLHR